MPRVRSDSIATKSEALAFYASELAGARHITCHGVPVTIIFERDGTHVFSAKCDDTDSMSTDERIERAIPAGKSGPRLEIRRFSIERARLMSHILPAISLFTVSVPESGGRPGHGKRVLYGPPLPESTDRMRVVLRPGPGSAFTCVSAYPVSQREWMGACRLKRAKFPP